MCKRGDSGPLVSGRGWGTTLENGFIVCSGLQEEWGINRSLLFTNLIYNLISIPTMEMKTLSNFYSEGTYSCICFKGQHINSWFYIVSKSLGKRAQEWFAPVSYLFYFIWQQNEDRVLNKSLVLSLTRFIEHYMLFPCSRSAVTPRHALQTPFVGIFLLISIFMISCSHKINLTFDTGLGRDKSLFLTHYLY